MSVRTLEHRPGHRSRRHSSRDTPRRPNVTGRRRIARKPTREGLLRNDRRSAAQPGDEDGGTSRKTASGAPGRTSSGEGVALEGQPVIQWYFHGSLSDLLRPFLRNGFVFDALEEPEPLPRLGLL